MSFCQISCRTIKQLLRCGDFTIFKKATICYVGFSKIRNCNCWYVSEDQHASPCQILCWSAKLLLRYGHFLIFKMVTVRHRGFLKIEILTAHTVTGSLCNMPYRAKFYVHWSNCCGDMAIFWSFQMAALWIFKIRNFNCQYG